MTTAVLLTVQEIAEIFRTSRAAVYARLCRARKGLDDFPLPCFGKIVRPFDNMRMSRSNEVERKFGSKKESLWIGHSEQVMTKHYLVLDDTDYAEAAEADLESQNPYASHAKPTGKDDKLE